MGHSSSGDSGGLVVIGSLNMDLVARVSRLPRPGETVLGRELQLIPGGKGANQAVAAARLGARCALVGRVGHDSHGDALLESLRRDGVETEHVQRTADCGSGIALIGVDERGENAIMVIPGANGRLVAADIVAIESVIAGARLVLLQLEVPPETVIAAVDLARCHHVPTLLVPAPAPSVFPAPLWRVDVLCPNETEAERLTGVAVRDVEHAAQAALILQQHGVRRPVITLGADGAFFKDESGHGELVPAFAVEVVDTTAAGDAFAGALGVALAEGRPLRDAVRFACAAGALATTRHGAQPSLPTREQVRQLLAKPDGRVV